MENQPWKSGLLPKYYFKKMKTTRSRPSFHPLCKEHKCECLIAPWLVFASLFGLINCLIVKFHFGPEALQFLLRWSIRGKVMLCVLNKIVTIHSHNRCAEECICQSVWLRSNGGWVVVNNRSGERSSVNVFLLLIDCSSVLGFL